MELGVFAKREPRPIDEKKIAAAACAKYGFPGLKWKNAERGGGVVHGTGQKVELDVEDKLEQLKPRAPVVTIMGHV